MRYVRAVSSLCLLFWVTAIPVVAQAQQPPADAALATWQRLHFLLGTWEAKTGGSGTAGATVVGNYTFREDLNGNAIVRTSTLDSCKGPNAFDCQHHDTLELFREGADVKALYVDSEGHVIHYTVTAPDAHTAVFSSSGPGPAFRLTYEQQGAGAAMVMSGKFQMAAPGSNDFHSYMEWSGAKK